MVSNNSKLQKISSFRKFLEEQSGIKYLLIKTHEIHHVVKNEIISRLFGKISLNIQLYKSFSIITR